MRKKKVYPVNEMARMHAILDRIGTDISVTSERESIDLGEEFAAFQSALSHFGNVFYKMADHIKKTGRLTKDEIDFAYAELVLEKIINAKDFVSGCHNEEPERYFSKSFLESLLDLSDKSWVYMNKFFPISEKVLKLRKECHKAVKKEVLGKFKKGNGVPKKTLGKKYRTLEGEIFLLVLISKEERKLVNKFFVLSKTRSYLDYQNILIDSYNSGLGAKQMEKTIPYKIIEDLGTRLGIKQGYIKKRSSGKI